MGEISVLVNNSFNLLYQFSHKVSISKQIINLDNKIKFSKTKLSKLKRVEDSTIHPQCKKCSLIYIQLWNVNNKHASVACRWLHSLTQPLLLKSENTLLVLFEHTQTHTHGEDDENSLSTADRRSTWRCLSAAAKASRKPQRHSMFGLVAQVTQAVQQTDGS